MSYGAYDVMQVCANGHVMTDMAMRSPELRKPFCPRCGANTIMECPECHAPIPGDYNVPGVMVLTTAMPTAPNNCVSCGSAYPWRQADIANAIGMLELEMEGPFAAEARDLVLAVAQDTPMAPLAVAKIKKGLQQLGKPAYDVAIKVVSDLVSAEVKKRIGL